MSCQSEVLSPSCPPVILLRHGMAELLGRMEPADLMSLAQVAPPTGRNLLESPFESSLNLANLLVNLLSLQTVTSRLVVTDSPAEAVESIILHTDKVVAL